MLFHCLLILVPFCIVHNHIWFILWGCPQGFGWMWLEPNFDTTENPNHIAIICVIIHQYRKTTPTPISTWTILQTSNFWIFWYLPKTNCWRCCKSCIKFTLKGISWWQSKRISHQETLSSLEEVQLPQERDGWGK